MGEEFTDTDIRENNKIPRLRTNTKQKTTPNKLLETEVTEDNFNAVSTVNDTTVLENDSSFNSSVTNHNLYISIPILIMLLLVCFLSIFFTLKMYRKRKKSHRDTSIGLRNSVACYLI